MLRHGLQEMHNRRLMKLPTVRASQPDRDRLEERYAEFLTVG
jgi:putative restriction endonuclease